MNKSESKYYNTALLMDNALLSILEKKEFQYITIKEICQTAGVNRSTFYLHYENTRDLLQETIDMLTKNFIKTFTDSNVKELEKQIINDGILIKPEYLIPYLNFIKSNVKILNTVHNNPDLFNVNSTYKRLCKNLFYPIISKFNIPEDKKHYILSFYTMGATGIVNTWVENNCSDPIDKIVDIIIECIGLKN